MSTPPDKPPRRPSAPHTEFAEIWRNMATPFNANEVKEISKGGKKMLYITARSVMNRLDFCVGVENWWDRYVPGEHSVMCELFIRLPDGQVISKMDAGGYAGMADQGDDDKSGFSDALKRAAAKFGVGRYLYGDGTPDYRPTPEAGPMPAPEVPPVIERPSGPPVDYGPRDGASTVVIPPFRQWMEPILRRHNEGWQATLTMDGKGDLFRAIPPEQLTNHLLKWWVERGSVMEASLCFDGKRDNRKCKAAFGRLWDSDTAAAQQEVLDYLDRELFKAAAIARVALAGMDDAGIDDEGIDDGRQRGHLGKFARRLAGMDDPSIGESEGWEDGRE